MAVFEQSLRMLHREAWPKTDLKSPEADSLLCRKFVDGILDIELLEYLRLHAAGDFTTTVSKARHFVDANELSRTANKPAIRTTSSVNCQAIVGGVVKGCCRIKVVWQRSMQSRHPTLMLMLGPGARRPFPGRDHRPPVTRQPEVPAELHPVVTRSDFKTRQTVSRVTRGMVRQAAAVGKATSRCNEVTMAPGHGMINDSQGKRPLVLRPRHRDLDGRHARATHAFHNHSQRVSGCQGKGAHAFVPRPRAAGDPVGGHRLVTEVTSRQCSSNSVRQVSASGTRDQLISHHRAPSTYRRSAAVDATCVVSQVATSTGKVLCLNRRHQPPYALSADSVAVILLAIQGMSSHRHPVHPVSQ